MRETIISPTGAERQELELEEGTGEILLDLDKKGKDRDWAGRKKRTMLLLSEIVDYARQIDQTVMTDSQYDSILHCGEYLEFLEDAQGNRKLAKSFFCRSKFCCTCNWRKSLKLGYQISKVIDKVQEDNKGCRWLFLTLTVHNCEGNKLGGIIKQMNNAFSLITSKTRTYHKADKLKKNLLGYQRNLEITVNKDDFTIHPHLHILLCVKSTYFKSKDNYMTQEEFTNLWADAMNLDYTPMVDIRKTYGGKKGIAEVAKYPMKMTDLLQIKDKSKEDAALIFIALANALRGKRLISWGGVMKKARAELKLESIESDNADLTNVGDKEEDGFTPIKQVRFKYDYTTGIYIC